MAVLPASCSAGVHCAVQTPLCYQQKLQVRDTDTARLKSKPWAGRSPSVKMLSVPRCPATAPGERDEACVDLIDPPAAASPDKPLHTGRVLSPSYFPEQAARLISPSLGAERSVPAAGQRQERGISQQNIHRNIAVRNPPHPLPGYPPFICPSSTVSDKNTFTIFAFLTDLCT